MARIALAAAPRGAFFSGQERHRCDHSAALAELPCRNSQRASETESQAALKTSPPASDSANDFAVSAAIDFSEPRKRLSAGKRRQIFRMRSAAGQEAPSKRATASSRKRS